MEINDTTFSAFIGYRLFGLAPFTIHRNKFKSITGFSLNRWLSALSCMGLIIFCLVTNCTLSRGNQNNNNEAYRYENQTLFTLRWS